MAKDCLGKEIKVGSKVAGPARSGAILHLKTGTVMGFDGKKIVIQWHPNRHYMTKGDLKPTKLGFTTLPDTLVVIE